MVNRSEQVAADAKEILHESVYREKPLCVRGGSEPAHLSLALSCRLMRDLRAVVLVLPGAVHHGRHHGAVRRGVAPQFVRDQLARRAALRVQQFPKETRGRPSITKRLDEDVEQVAVLVYRPPEISTAALNFHKQLVEIPGVAQASLPSSQRARVLRTKGPTPLSNRFVGHRDSTLREQILGIAEAQAEPMIKPHGVADDFRRKSVSGVAELSSVHGRSVPGTSST